MATSSAPQHADDPSIRDADALWRRILPAWVVAVEGGGYRPSSSAFLDNHTTELSIHLAALTTPDNALAGHPDDNLAEIWAAVHRTIGHAVVRDPTDDDPSHGLICPPPQVPNKRRKADARRMAAQARWVVLRPPPPGAPYTADAPS